MKKIYLLTIVLSMLLCATVLYTGCGSNATGGGGGGGGGAKVGNGILYMTGRDNNCIFVYDNANTRGGTIVPDRIISGEFTQIQTPRNNTIFVDPSTDKIYVGSHDNHAVLVFANASTLNGNVTPEQIITYEGMLDPYGLFVKANRLYVADGGNNKVFIFDASANGHTIPIATIESTSVGASFYDLYVNTNNTMYTCG